MKNWIIALLVIACVFLLAQSLGVFRYGSIIDRNHYQAFEAKREKRVQAASQWFFATAYSADDLLACEANEGIEAAVELVNRKGGICGKKVTLQKKLLGDSMAQYQQSVQQFCSDERISVMFGPYHSGYIPSARAISQLQGLPLISPVTVVSEKLPALEPDNFVSFFPPVTMWVQVILDDMTKRGFRQLIIISPELGSYGDIFCTALERFAQKHDALEHVYRMSYQSPLLRREIARRFPDIQSINLPTAVFFGGTFREMDEFDEQWQAETTKFTTYGTDDLYVPQVLEFPCAESLLLPKLELTGSEAFEKYFQEKYGKKPNYQHVLGAETLFAVAEALEKEGGYHVQPFLQRLRQIGEDKLKRANVSALITIKNAEEMKKDFSK